MQTTMQQSLRRASSCPGTAPVPIIARPCVRVSCRPPMSATFLAVSPRPWGNSHARPHGFHGQAGGRTSRKQVVVSASWGAPVDFTAAKVVSNKLAAPGMHQLLVDVGSTIAAGYKNPGQYIQAKTAGDAKAGFFAIASGPDPNNQGVLELLIKVQPGAAAETLCGLQAGAELLVSPVQGKGFPVDRIPAADFPTVLMFATGSGISPIKAVIESGLLEVGKRKEVRLYYGTRDPESTAYQSLVSGWQQQGINVVQVHSGDEKKYVQGKFAEDVANLASPGQVGVLLCGQKDMCTAVTELAKQKGVEQIMMNF